MTKWQRLKPKLVKVCESIQLMIAGAALLALYLSYTNSADAWLSREITPLFLIPFCLLNLALSYLRPNDEISVGEPSPRWSGVAVVLATGLTAAFVVGLNFFGNGSLLGAAAILVATILAAAIMWRFASLHESEIGEAQFTSGSN